MFRKLESKLEIIQELIDVVDDEELLVLSKFLRGRILCPESYVTLLGETSSGKSTIINSLLKRQVLHTGAAPTTGAITEIVFDPYITDLEKYAVNKNATMEKLNDELFDQLYDSPDDNLSRLQLIVPEIKGLSGLRLFDTPGYGSIIESHEEVLKEFIPNSDVIVYVIGYKIGIQENDFVFMRYIQELIDEGTDVVIVVNRCPENLSKFDRRIKEIKEYAHDLFHRDLPVFSISTAVDDSGVASPNGELLWNYIGQMLNGDEYNKKLYDSLNLYLDELLSKVINHIENLELNCILKEHEKEALRKSEEKLHEKARTVIDNDIIPTFNKLIKQSPTALSNVKAKIYSDISMYIDLENNAHMDETIAFVNNHALPTAISKEMREYTNQLLVELDAMNERVDDYLNEAIADYHEDIKLSLESNFEYAARISGGKFVGKIAEYGLTRYFVAFGGRGGVGAGVANGAKHLLKKTGDLFGKKFSRETYNTLAHTLKKIGATSTKAIGTVVTVLIEVAQIIYEYSTWKSKLKRKLEKGVDAWYDSVLNTVKEDLTALREENVRALNTIVEAEIAQYKVNEHTTDKENIDKLLNALEITNERLKEIENE